jgi:lysophosphatidylcholine acyltransferase/lyso-PAF acetyltransferase
LNFVFSPFHPAFTPKIEHKNIPLFSLLAKGVQSIWVDRGASDAERNKIVEAIMERQQQIEDQGLNFAPVCVFAEGTTTTGEHLLKFKRGAFQSMRAI